MSIFSQIFAKIGGKAVSETAETIESIVKVRTQFIRFAKIALIAFCFLLITILIVYSASKHEPELTNQLLNLFIELMKSTFENVI